MESYEKIREIILLEQDIDLNHKPLDIIEYVRYAFYNGGGEEKREVIKAFGDILYIHNQFITSSMYSD